MNSVETLPVGATVSLHGLDKHTVEASVRWALPGRAGLRLMRRDANVAHIPPDDAGPLLLDENLRLSKREERRPVELRGYVVRSNNSIVDVRLLDLSYNGCGLETITPLQVGEEVKLSVLGRGAVAARVQWYRGRKAGLLFAPEGAPQQSIARHAKRIPVKAQASLRRNSSRSYPVEAFDLSTAGCKCEFVERPEIGERVWIKFHALESLEATVSWIEGFKAGLEFHTPLHPAVFDMLLARLGTS